MAIVAGGPQEVQYIDGLKLSVVSDVNMSVNVDFSDPITKDMVPQGMRSLCKSAPLLIYRALTM